MPYNRNMMPRAIVKHTGDAAFVGTAKKGVKNEIDASQTQGFMWKEKQKQKNRIARPRNVEIVAYNWRILRLLYLEKS